MIYNNEQQLLKVEDELFNLALLGLLEIEGRKLIEEKEQMVQRGEYASPPADQLRRIENLKIERMALSAAACSSKLSNVKTGRPSNSAETGDFGIIE